MTLQIPFSPPPENLQLTNGEVHVFYAVLDQPLWRLEQLAETLSADERQRASRFHFGKDKYRYVAGRGMLREFLGRMLGANPNRSTRTRCERKASRKLASMNRSRGVGAGAVVVSAATASMSVRIPRARLMCDLNY